MKSVQSKLIRFLSFVFSSMFVMSAAFSAQAKTTAQLKSEKEKIQQEIDEAQEKLEELEAEMDETEEYVSTLQSKITLLEDKIDTLENEKETLQSEIDAIETNIENTEAEIAEAEADIEKKQAEFDEIYETYCQRLRAMYISGNVSTLEILLESGDMSTVLTRAEMVKRISEQDSQTLEELLEKMDEIQAEKQLLEDKRQELTEYKENLDSQKAELQASIDEISSSKSELDAEVAECNSLLAQLESQSSEVQELIETDTAAQEKIDAEIRAAIAAAASSVSSASSSSSSYSAGSGTLGYPTSSRTITAGFPNYSSGRYHGGVDFQCSVGTAVYAAAAGTVVTVKSLTYSYGKYIVISHSNGLSTLYAHNSQLLVSVGDTVTKGQLIAYSGQSGNATGPHLHFEVWLNGTRVNPLNYLG
ncbi:MAG: peptidoglycan DD-metalloendopeptidase family protein [Clostridiales bacterium]|nr:peptidoglycan DD-metalloendopeptidase family protein [Clostridiales bacterium]